MVEHSNIPIAVVGIGALFPQSPSALGFWHNILEGVDLIDDVPEGRWRTEDFYDPDQSVPDKTYARRGGFIEPTAFDAMKYGVPPNIIEATDTSQLLALIVAQQVLDDAAQGQFEELDRDRISVVLGVTSGQELMNEMASRLQRPQWVKGLREAGLPEDEVQAACDRISEQYTPWQESTFPGLLGNVVAGRIANRFDLGGTNAVTDAACGSTLAAMSMGLNELYLGHSDIVIAGGVDTFNDIFMYMCFSKTPALSATGDCRPFSDAADGTMLGEGLAMFALKRLDDAERDGDEVYAVLRGMGSSSDGRAKSIYAPVSEGQAKALERAYERADYSPDTVELVEAHGTGTKAGDVAEFGGLNLVFDETGREDRQWCALGSVKSQVGHTKAAAGAAGLFKVVMALHHKVLPPTLKVDRPNPKLGVEDSPFYINTEKRPWIRSSDYPRRGSVSAFGFGGSNFHLAAEEYLGDNPRPRFRHTATELVVLGGDDGAAIAAACTALQDQLDDNALDRIARDSQQSFDGGAARLGVVADSIDDLRRKLSQAADTIRSAPDNDFTLPNGIYYGTGEAGRTAFLFPGQGSQFVGMGADLAMAFDGAREVWDRCADLELGDEPLHRVVFPIPAFDDETRTAQTARLRATEWAQPALGAASLASLAIVEQLGLKPDAVGGHSFGEVTALCAAGVIDEATALRVARRRGELMAEAAESTTGTMTAVQEAADRVESLLEEWGSQAVVANYNGPRQTVLSGSVEAIEDAEAQLEAAGLSFKRLNVATAFHSSIVAGSAAPFGEFLSDIDVDSAEVPVWANSSAEPYPDDDDAIRETLSGQIAAPVRFEQMIRAMLDDRITTFVEVGPGTVLTRLVRRIAQDDSIACISTDARGRDGLTALWHALGQWVAAGATPDFSALWDNAYVTEPPGPAPKLSVDIWGGNYNRPYPPADGVIPPPNPSRPEPKPTPVQVEPARAPAAEPVQPENHMSNRDDSSQPQQPQATAPQPTTTVDAAWVHAFSESQRQMADAHAAYQHAMAQTHTAFLQAVASSQANMTSMLGAGAPVAPQLTQHVQPPAPPAPTPQPPAPAPMQPQYTAPQPTAPPAPAPVAAPPSPPAPHAVAPAPPAAVQPAPPATNAAAPASPARDYEALLLDVVADKTGYPAEMLELEMQLEADLGIDSIKRVEILSALQESAPELPEMDGNAMGQLQTLGEIVEFLGEHTPDGGRTEAETKQMPTVAGNPTAPVAAVAPAPATKTNANGAGGDIKTVLLAAVSDKTGYPTEMLELDMKLEADLGIDSIKRVEILSAVNEALPELPEVDGSDMAGLGTLQEILDFMHDAVGEKKRPHEPVAPPVDRSRVDTIPTTPLPQPTSEVEMPDRFVLHTVDAPLPHERPEPLKRGHEVTLVDDGQGVALSLAAALEQQGLETAIVSEASGIRPETNGVVYLRGLRDFASIEEASDLVKDAFDAARIVAPNFSENGGYFVTVQDTGGNFALDEWCEPTKAVLGGLAGLAKTAAQEWPKATVRAIDFDAGHRDVQEIAQELAEELLAGGDDLEIGRPDGERVRIELRAGPNSPRPIPPLGEDDVIVVSGGARGVTAACVIELARRTKGRFALLGRSALPEPDPLEAETDDALVKRALLERAKAAGESISPKDLGWRASRIAAAREIRQTLRSIEEAGGEARYISVDVRDVNALCDAFDEIRDSWGAIRGLVHGAGVIEDRRLQDKTDEQFDKVFGTKVAGFWALCAASAQDPLKVLCVFSSVAGRAGNVGQADYAMANEVLNKSAQIESRRRDDCVVKSIAWGPWDGGMVGPDLRKVFEERGIALIGIEAGARTFANEVLGDAADVEIVVGSLIETDDVDETQQLPAASTVIERIVKLTTDTHPFLEDHEIDGTPVLPLVCALEMFVEAVGEWFEPRDLALTDVRVKHGVRLRNLADGEMLKIRAERSTNGIDQAFLELHDADGKLCYTATAIAHPQPEEASIVPQTSNEAYDGVVYDGQLLFHGPSLRVLEDVHQPGSDGMSAIALTSQGAGWSTPHLDTDPAALDAAMQLAVLWTSQRIDGLSLPLGVADFRAFRPFDVDRVNVVVRERSSNRSRTLTDIDLLGPNGELVAAFRGVEVYKYRRRD